MKYILLLILTITLSACSSDIDKTKKRASQGDAYEQYALGLSYLNGSDVPRNSILAEKWLLKAAEQGYVEAQYTLAKEYRQSHRSESAVKWFRKAAEKGHTLAQYYLAEMYEEGEGVPENIAMAIKWYTKSAEDDFSLALYNLGRIHEFGVGVEVNYAIAHEYYRKSAEQGFTSAQNKVARMYASGKGVSKNLVKAYLWYSVSYTRHDFLSTKESLSNIKAKMTSKQIAQAQELALKCWESKFKDCD